MIETICDGWTYVESSIDLFDQTGNDLTFVLAGDPTFTYTLQAPDTYDTCCTITGIFRDMDQNEFGITGDSEVCTCEEPVPTPIRAIPDECVDAGENVVIEIGFSMPATGVVVETICDGWTYVESSLDPGDVIVLGNDITFTLVEVEVFTYTLQAPDTPDTCCTITGTFMDPLQILWPVVGDENVCTCPDNPPIPDIITPANGATVEGMVTVNVVDLSGEGDVLYCLIEYLDGTTGEIVNDTTAPYSGDWDTTAVPNGDYTIRATMEDGIGQIGTDEITVTVDNPVCPNSDWYLELEAGWNLVSVPKMLEGAPVNATTLFNLVMGEDANYYDAATGTWVSNNDITDVKPCQGYWVLKSAPETICIDFETGWTEPPVQELYVGWNIIGHVSTDAWSAEEFLGITGLEGKCTMLKTLGAQGEIGWAYYYPTAPGLSTFVDMTPGYGYWIAVTEDTVMFGTA
ncbi:MAG: hypothetical protein SYNGOMJ08_00805 [Candidatus Syntrophoarchaeum sp. GoM_oil]|nr:MAG: hypothetical protein SYNGOMJ08_00805 [Candidatus Syntrophoarchaeum sp. GoM_oil]